MFSKNPMAFAELEQLQPLLSHPALTVAVLAEAGGLPIYRLGLGARDPGLPTLLLVGGIHGSERIGSQILLGWLTHVLSRLSWDQTLQHLLGRVRIELLPLVNVTGLARGTRATADGIDLMRNAPVQAQGRVLWPLGGQRLSRHLPWYRGQQLAPENQAVHQTVLALLQQSPFVLAMDLHSGFGHVDRLWFPYAGHRRPPAHLAEAVALCDRFNQDYPLHDYYRIEPQSLNYMAHGDLWDFLYDESRRAGTGLLLPFTLEMGSWLWLRKNPRQLFAPAGLFHPILPHRLRRVMRRHWHLLDFLLRAAADHPHWRPRPEQRAILHQVGLERWYG